METIYLVATHGHQDADFEVQFAVNNFQQFEELCEKWELTLGDNFKQESFEDLGWYNGLRYMAYAFEVDTPHDSLYILCANGDERYCWEGEVLGLFTSKQEVKNRLVKLFLNNGYDSEEDFEDELIQFDKYNSCSDIDWTNWKCLLVELEQNIQ